MTRTSAFSSLLFTGLLFGVALPRASAQLPTAGTGGTTTTNSTGGITWVLNKIGDAAYTDTTNVTPINKDACDNNSLLTFYLNNIPPGYRYLETWSGSQCADGARETRIGTTVPCVFVGDKEQQDPTGTTADSNFTIPASAFCAMGDGVREVFVLPVNTVSTSATASIYADIILTVQTAAPDAPIDVVGGSGETQIQVSWKQPPTATNYYYIVVDTRAGTASDGGTSDIDSGIVADASVSATAGAGTGGASDASGAGGSAGSSGASGGGGTTTTVVGTADPACPSRWLVPGAVFDPSPDKLPDGVIAHYINKIATSYTFSGDELNNTPLGAVAVMALDLGKNRSVLSNVSCVRVIKTSGFWDGYKAEGGSAAQGCGCSTLGAAHPATTHTGFAALAALGLAGAWWRTRRRT